MEDSDLPGNDNRLTIKHINAHSLEKKIECLQLEAEGYDIIGISESWLHDGISDDLVSLEGYHTPLRRDREENRYGGVALYCNEMLAQKRRDDIHEPGVESVWSEVFVGATSILIGVIYRPPDESIQYWTKLEDLLVNAKESHEGTLLICGDLNCYMKMRNNKLESLLNKLHMEQIIKETTHRTATSATIIDIIATNSIDIIEDVKVEPPSLSNHCDVAVLMNIRKAKHERFKRRVYQYEKADWANLNRDLREKDWDGLLREKDTNDMVNIWTKVFMDAVKKWVPNKLLHIEKFSSPWMNDEIRKLRRKKLYKHKRAAKTNSIRDWRKFYIARANLTDKIRQAKRDHDTHIGKKIDEAEGKNEKLWWRIVKSFYNKSRNTKQQSPPLIVDGKPTQNDREKAEEFNKYFITASKIHEDNGRRPGPPRCQVPEQCLEIINFQASEVEKILKNLDPQKAVGPDEISPRALRETAQTIAPTLAKIYNFSMRNRIFQDLWKLANITPIHKKGNKETP